MPQTKIEELENGNIKVTIPLIFRAMANRRKIVVPEENGQGNDPLVLAIARGRRWQTFIDEGRFRNVRELAVRIGRDPGNVAGCIRLAMLAPEIIHRIISGDYPPTLTYEKVRGKIPELWEDQMKELLG